MQDNAKAVTKVLIVDDHPVVRSGCRLLLAGDSTIRIEEAADALAPDVIPADAAE